VRGVSDEVQAAHPEIPWATMRGLRNLLVHACFGIDDRIVWATATMNVLPLAAPLRRLHDLLETRDECRGWLRACPRAARGGFALRLVLVWTERRGQWWRNARKGLPCS